MVPASGIEPLTSGL